MPGSIDSKAAVKKLFDLYRDHGVADYLGEQISQAEHACQAGMLAELEGASPDICIGAFLHDIGHLMAFDDGFKQGLKYMGDVGVMDHENVGADVALAAGLPETTAEIIRNHIVTKRWLVTTRPEYYNKLSDASKETFKYQGGKLSDEKREAFESSPLHKTHVRMRQWDEAAKDASPRMRKLVSEKYNIDHWEDMAMSLVKADS